MNTPKVLPFTLKLQKFENLFLFLIVEDKFILNFRLTKRISDVDQLRSLHSLVKKQNFLNAEKFLLCDNTATFIFFAKEKEFTGNPLNKKSLDICTKELSPISQQFFDFLKTTKFPEFGGKNYVDLRKDENKSQTLKKDFSTFQINKTLKENFNARSFSQLKQNSKDEQFSERHSLDFFREKHTVGFYQTGVEENDFDVVFLPNKDEFLELYKNISRKKLWVRIVFLLCYVFGVRLTYEQMIDFEQEQLEKYLKEEHADPTSLIVFGRRFQNEKFNYIEELLNLSRLHFYREKVLLSKNNRILSKRSVEQQILFEFNTSNKDLCKSLVFLRYNAVLHHLLIFDDIQLTSETYNVSIPNLYRIKKVVRFEFDKNSFSLEASTLFLKQ